MAKQKCAVESCSNKVDTKAKTKFLVGPKHNSHQVCANCAVNTEVIEKLIADNIENVSGKVKAKLNGLQKRMPSVIASGAAVLTLIAVNIGLFHIPSIGADGTVGIGVLLGAFAYLPLQQLIHKKISRKNKS